MKDIFFFDSMLTPKIIIFIYWLGLISVVVGALATMFSEYGGASGPASACCCLA